MAQTFTMSKVPHIYEYEEGNANRLARKSKESPFFPIGIAGLTLCCLVGAYKFRSKGSMSTSVFLMQLRVVAQGAVVATLTGGLCYTMAKEYIFEKKT